MRFFLTLLLLLQVSAFCYGQDVTKLYEAKQITSTAPDGQTLTMPYRLMKPKTIEPDKRYPLLLFLHGGGERGSDNEQQLKHFPTWIASDENREKYPCFVVVPQVPIEMGLAAPPQHDPAPHPFGEMTRPMRGVIGVLNAVVDENPIDPARIYLTGMSMGGYGSWDLATRMPERFAAVVPLCGGGDESYAGRLVDVPIWAWHGDKDDSVPVERSRLMIEAIKVAGGKPKYTELKDAGHDIWKPAYTRPDGVLPWMFSQVKPAAASP